MQSGIAHLWETRQHTDVTFLVGHSRVPAHRAILASQSEYFNRLLFGEMIEARAGAEIPLKDTPLKAFQLLLRYAYSGSLEMKDVPIEVGRHIDTVSLGVGDAILLHSSFVCHFLPLSSPHHFSMNSLWI